MENFLQTAMNQARAPNTIKLRKLYTEYAASTQSEGNEPVPFEMWAKSNYPEQKILHPQ